MRKEDKIKNMVKVNKLFQERFNANDPTIQEKEIIYTYVPDIFPELSKLLK
jgi:hypothetical protein